MIAHRYRPLDNRSLYKVDEFIDRPGTISRIYEQVPSVVSLLTMDTRTTEGPVVIATDTLPGYNSFRGAYETHAFRSRWTGPAELPGVGEEVRRPTYYAGGEGMGGQAWRIGRGRRDLHPGYCKCPELSTCVRRSTGERDRSVSRRD